MSSRPSEIIVGPTVNPGCAEVSIIVPTFNERDNISELVARLDRHLSGHRWEAIFVDDDSNDGTANRVREIARRDARVRCLQRVGRRGLSSACVEGMLASSAPYLAVIDADLQHDESLLKPMLESLKAGEAEIVIGSRYNDGGGVGDWAQSRAKISRLSTLLSRLVLRADVTDPMSGFFMLRRDVLERSVHGLSSVGFKILLDILVSSPELPVFKELPYEFRARQKGESKLDNRAAWDYLLLLLDKKVGHILPVRFVSFAIIGGFGVLIHMLTLMIFFRALDLDFTLAQSVATMVAITSNYTINNIITYSDMRLYGWEWLRGWATFTLVCGIGALANIGLASFLFAQHNGWFLSALAGIALSSVWNYAVTSVYTWRRPRARVQSS